MTAATKLTLPEGYIDDQGRPMGLFLDMPEAEYYVVKAFSYSGSKEFAKSPAHFQAYLRKEWEVDQDREKFKAVHLLCLEPELQSRIVVKDGVWRGALKEEVLSLQRQGKIVLKTDALEEAKAISNSVKRHSLASRILANSYCEVSLFAEINGVYCKGRIDILSVLPQGICIGDLKNFTNLADEGLIGYQIGRNKYHFQQGLYTELVKAVFGAPPIKRYWIFCEDKDPYGVKVRNCPDAIAEAGWLAISELLPTYQECLESNVWPSYPEDELDAGMPDKFFGVIGGVYE